MAVAGFELFRADQGASTGMSTPRSRVAEGKYSESRLALSEGIELTVRSTPEAAGAAQGARAGEPPPVVSEPEDKQAPPARRGPVARRLVLSRGLDIPPPEAGRVDLARGVLHPDDADEEEPASQASSAAGAAPTRNASRGPDVEAPPGYGTKEYFQWQEMQRRADQKAMEELDAGLQAELNRLSGKSSATDAFMAVLITSLLVTVRDGGAHGIGQVCRHAAAQALNVLASPSEGAAAGSLAMGSATVFLGMLNKFSQQAGTTFADAMGVTNPRARRLLRYLPLLIALATPQAWAWLPGGVVSVGAHLASQMVGRLIGAIVRDAIQQKFVGLLPTLQFRKRDEATGEWVALSSAESKHVALAASSFTAIPYVMYFHSLRERAKRWQSALVGVDKDKADNGNWGERFSQKTGSILGSIVMEAMDGGLAPWMQGAVAGAQGMDVRLKWGSIEDWKKAQDDYTARRRDHSGMRFNLGVMGGLVEEWRDLTGDEWQTAWQFIADLIHVSTEYRGTFVGLGRAEQAAAAGVAGEVRFGDMNFYPSVPVIPGGVLARERAEARLPPIRSRIELAGIGCRVGTSGADFRNGHERLIVRRDDFYRLQAELQQLRPCPMTGSWLPPGADSGTIHVRQEALVDLDYDEIDVEAGYREFYPTSLFVYGQSSCTVQDTEFDNRTGEKYVLFSSLSPVPDLQVFVPPDRKNFPDSAVYLYRMRESELRDRAMPHVPLASNELHEGLEMRLPDGKRFLVREHTDWGIGRMEGRGWERDVRVVVSSAEPNEQLHAAARASGTTPREFTPDGGDRRMTLWRYAIKKDWFDGLLAVAAGPGRDDRDGAAPAGPAHDPRARAAAAGPRDDIGGRPLHVDNLLLIEGAHAMVRELPTRRRPRFVIDSVRPIPALARHATAGHAGPGSRYELDPTDLRNAHPIVLSEPSFLLGGERMTLAQDPHTGDTLIRGTNGRENLQLRGILDPEGRGDGYMAHRAEGQPFEYRVAADVMHARAVGLRRAIEREARDAFLQLSAVPAQARGRFFGEPESSSRTASSIGSAGPLSSVSPTHSSLQPSRSQGEGQHAVPRREEELLEGRGDSPAAARPRSRRVMTYRQAPLVIDGDGDDDGDHDADAGDEADGSMDDFANPAPIIRADGKHAVEMADIHAQEAARDRALRSARELQLTPDEPSDASLVLEPPSQDVRLMTGTPPLPSMD